MLTFWFCEGVFFCVKLLLQLMIVLLNVCVYSVRFTALLIPPLSGVLCWLIIKISFPFRPTIKNRPSVSSGAAEVDYYAI